MAVPSKNWSDVSDSQIDADSPLDATLMMQIRNDLVHLKEWLGLSYAAAQDHDHDGVNSKSVVLADAVVTVAKLKMAQGSYSTALNQTNYYISTGMMYVHLPRMVLVGGASAAILSAESTGTSDGTFHTQFKLNFTTGGSCAVYWEAHIN